MKTIEFTAHRTGGVTKEGREALNCHELRKVRKRWAIFLFGQCKIREKRKYGKARA